MAPLAPLASLSASVIGVSSLRLGPRPNVLRVSPTWVSLQPCLEVGEWRMRFVLRRLDGLKLSHQGWCPLPVGEGRSWRGGGLCLWDIMRLRGGWPSVLWSPEVPPQGGDCPAAPLPCPPTSPHSPNLLLLFQKLSYSCQTKQSCLEASLGGFTFSPATLIGPRIGCKCVGSSWASAVDGAPSRGPCDLMMIIHRLCL